MTHGWISTISGVADYEDFKNPLKDVNSVHL